jgi:hypothetical protein
MHYSWDFALKRNYPYEVQQVGPIYFKSPRKAQLFGGLKREYPDKLITLLMKPISLKKMLIQ